MAHLPNQAVPEPGNQLPQVRIRAEEMATVLGSKSVRFMVEATDPDGDAVIWEWHTGEGPLHTNESVVGRIFTSGEHVVSVVARDEHGAESVAMTTITVPQLTEYGRSISISTANAGRSRVTPMFPGESAGVVPSASWVSLAGGKGRQNQSS